MYSIGNCFEKRAFLRYIMRKCNLNSIQIVGREAFLGMGGPIYPSSLHPRPIDDHIEEDKIC